ncbi:hypothetical protein ES703_101838 [subsurface metagenome]
MAKPEELEELKKAFTPEVTLSAFKDVGKSIVAQVEQNYPVLGTTRKFKVIMDRETGRIESLGWLFKM